MTSRENKKEEISKIQDRLKRDKNIINYIEEEIRYMQKPLGSALYKGRPRKDDEDKAKPTDRLVCETCGKEFFRSGRAQHKATQYHILHENLNKKLMKMLLNK